MLVDWREGKMAIAPPPAINELPEGDSRVVIPVKLAAPHMTRLGSLDSGQTDQMFDKPRELRAEVQDLQGVLDLVGKGQISLQTYAPYIQKTMEDVAALIDEIPEGSDSIRHIRNCWEQMQVNPLLVHPENLFSPQDQLNYLAIISDQIRKIVFQVGMISISYRLNDWLSKARPGYYIPFHLVFADEVPNMDDRQRILDFLAITPEAIKDGYIDASNGLVYRYSKSIRDRLWSVVLLLLIFLVATGLVVGAAYLPFPGWPLSVFNVSTLVAGWAALLVGVSVHLAVGSVKRRQSQGDLPPVIVLGDLPFIINARLGQFTLKLGLALVGLFGLVLSAGVAQTTIFNAFLVGYSLDSFVELFSSSIEQRANAQVSAMKEQFDRSE
jgi:hypothetical protein